MEQLRPQSFTSDDHIMQDMPMHPVAYADSSRNAASDEAHHQSFDGQRAVHELSSQMPGSVEHAFDPWLLEAVPCDSPSSTASVSTPSEGVSTPSYPAQLSLPVYQLYEESLQACASGSMSYSTYEGIDRSTWHPHYYQNESWQVPPFAPAWDVTAYSGLVSLASSSMVDMPPSTVPLYPNVPNMLSARRQIFDSSPLIPEEKGPGDNVTESSSSDSDDSEYEDSDGGEGKTTDPVSRNHIPSILKLGKWDLTMDPLNRPEKRLYVCNECYAHGMEGRPCQKRFVRPEHLRRHIKTVHSGNRDYRCKVPQCARAFSRGDNLRDHYWTHLYRGGRVGKNDKMTLPELKLILGPKEKKLVRKLKTKLSKIKVTHRRVKA